MSSITIKAQRDMEDIIRQALAPYMTTYVRPYPAEPSFPNLLIQQVGGTDDNADIDRINIAVDARAATEEGASYLLRTAIGTLRVIAASQSTPIRDVIISASGSWGKDPNNPTVALCSATLVIIAHKETITIPEKS